MRTEASEPSISIVITVYNKRKYLAECLASVLKQSLEPHQIIVVDDGSTDGSSEFLAQINDARLEIVSQDNRGVCSARNVGLDLATGDWILFLDGDDWIGEEYLASMMELAMDIDVVAAPWVSVYPGGNHFVQQPTDPKEDPGAVAASSPWAVHAAIVSVPFLRREGIRWDESFDRQSSEDNRFWFQVCQKARISLQTKAAAYYRIKVEGSRTGKQPTASWVEGFLRSLVLNLSEETISADGFVAAVGAIEDVYSQVPQSSRAALSEHYYSFLDRYFQIERKRRPTMVLRRVVGMAIFCKMKQLSRVFRQ